MTSWADIETSDRGRFDFSVRCAKVYALAEKVPHRRFFVSGTIPQYSGAKVPALSKRDFSGHRGMTTSFFHLGIITISQLFDCATGISIIKVLMAVTKHLPCNCYPLSEIIATQWCALTRVSSPNSPRPPLSAELPVTGSLVTTNKSNLVACS